MSAINTVTATINGTVYTLEWDSSESCYKKTITAPIVSSWTQSDHVYGISVTATDVAGNSTTIDKTDATFGSNLRLRVRDTTDPTATFTYPTAGSTITNGTPLVTLTVEDTSPGIDLSTFWLKVDGGASVSISDCTYEATATGYNISYRTPYLLNAQHTITAGVSDYDENVSATASVTFTVNVANPDLTVTSPIDGLVTNQTTINVVGTTNNSTQTSVTLTVKVDSGAAQTATVASDGSFSHPVTVSEGQHTITVRSEDPHGLYSQITRTITVDTTAPVFTEVTLDDNDISVGDTFTIKVKVSS